MVEEQLAGAPSPAGWHRLTVEVRRKGRPEYVYGITVKTPGPRGQRGRLESPMIKVEVTEDVWRKGGTGKLEGAMDMFMNMGQNTNRKRDDTLYSIRGTMNVELAVPDGSQADLKVAFNDAASPEVTFKIGLEDWALMQKGELAGPTAFMTGKMKIEGDMPFAMALGNLMTYRQRGRERLSRR